MGLLILKRLAFDSPSFLSNYLAMTLQHHPSSIPSSQQLEILVDRIFNSRQTFIRLVEHLLADLRSQREAGRVDVSATPVESKRSNERSKETLSDARSTPMVRPECQLSSSS